MEMISIEKGFIKVKVLGYDITTQGYVCQVVSGLGTIIYIPWEILHTFTQCTEYSYTITEDIKYKSHHVYKSVEDSKITLDPLFHENGEFYYEFPDDRTRRFSKTNTKTIHPKYWEVVGTTHALTLTLKFRYKQESKNKGGESIEYVVAEELYTKYEIALPYREYILHI